VQATTNGHPGVALRLRSVSKTFPGVQALKGVDLEIASGSVHALLGHNGCGKSTLVKALAGVHAPDPGAAAWIDGEQLDLGDPVDAERKGLRFVHQDLGIILELGAIDNVGLVLGFERRRGHINWARQATVTKELLAEFGFALDPWQPLGKASPPERAAVAIVRAVAGWERGRGVLVLDEPTAALPAHEVHHLFRLIREVSATGTAVLLVSHRLDEVMTIADHATVMRAGEIVWNGALADTSIGDLVRLIADTDTDSDTDTDTDTDATEQDAAATGAPRRGFDEVPVTLSVSNVVGRYLRGVSLAVREGEIVGVAGLLGSGREELPYVIAGAQTAGVTGTFTIGGVSQSELSLLKARELGVALVPADRAQEAIFSDFTTSENVSLPGLPSLARSGVLPLAGVRKFSRHWLQSVHADENASERKITTLSGGNQQKAVLARWLSVAPRVLVLSEPTAGIDIGARHMIYQQLQQRAAAGLSVLMASSDVEDLLASCDRVIVLRDGVTVAELEGEAMSKPAILGAMEGVE
jgi:ribose transport system ATP-binding protein